MSNGFKGRRVHWRKFAYALYIGRPTKWGNPFVIGPDGNRKDVIRKFERYLLANDNLIQAILDGELRNQILGCWCGEDEACHGDVLLKYDEMPKEELIALRERLFPPRKRTRRRICK